MTALGWILATTPDDTLRDASQAVRLAERATDLTGRGDTDVLDVLASAYAAAGRFDRAVETTQDALRLDPAGALAAAILEREQLYRQHEPYREPAGTVSAPTL